MQQGWQGQPRGSSITEPRDLHVSCGRWALEPTLLRSLHAGLYGLRDTDTKTKSCVRAPAARRGERVSTKALQEVTNLLRTCCQPLAWPPLSKSENSVAGQRLKRCLRPSQFSEEITVAQGGGGAWLLTWAWMECPGCKASTVTLS